MQNKSTAKRREAITKISKGLGLTTPTGNTPTSESQLLTVIINAFQSMGNDWPHKMLEMIDKNRKAQK